MRLLAFSLLLLLLFSCDDSEKLKNFDQIDIATSQDLYDVDISSDGVVTITGGYVWSNGFMIETNETVNQIKIDTISNKALFYLLRTIDDRLISVGTDGYVFEKRTKSEPWIFHRTSQWDILHHIIQTPNGYLASGGKSYGTGYIYHINHSFQIDKTFYFKHEISEVKYISDDRMISVGWGNIQRSDDNGFTWRTLPNEGDFYASVLFTSPQHGIIIGYNGTLLETNDGGDTWHKSKAEISNNGSNSFRKLMKIEDGPIMIAGNQGKLWKSEDNGKSWQFYKLPTKSDIYDIARCPNGDFVAVGSNGFLARLRF